MEKKIREAIQEAIATCEKRVAIAEAACTAPQDAILDDVSFAAGELHGYRMIAAWLERQQGA